VLMCPQVSALLAQPFQFIAHDLDRLRRRAQVRGP
jgi:hypothetical protein